MQRIEETLAYEETKITEKQKMNKKKFMKTWMYGLTIFVLIIVAGIITGIALIPLMAIATALQSTIAIAITTVIGLVLSIFFLGWVFERFKVRRKGR